MKPLASRRLQASSSPTRPGVGRSNGGTRVFQDDPHWRDLVLFYEYFHGDNGAGLGASHQTGWTDLVARLMHLFATSSAEQVLAQGGKAVFIEEPVPDGPDRLKD